MATRTVLLDSNVVVKGLAIQWGAAKGVLILGARQLLQVATSEIVRHKIERRLTDLDDPLIRLEYDGLTRRLRLRIVPAPDDEAVSEAEPRRLPTLRHRNDVAVLVSAMQARPDWLCSEDDRSFNPKMARLTGPRIVTPAQLLADLVGRS